MPDLLSGPGNTAEDKMDKVPAVREGRQKINKHINK